MPKIKHLETKRKNEKESKIEGVSEDTNPRKEEEDDEERRLTSLLFAKDSSSSFCIKKRSSSSSVWHDEDDKREEEKGWNRQNKFKQSKRTNEMKEQPLFQIDRMGETTTDPISETFEEPEQEKNFQSLPHVEKISSPNQKETVHPEKREVAWVDEDDQNITVSLASTANRLKKLRSQMSEDKVDGSDYQRRLRERFIQISRATTRTDWARVDKVLSESRPENSDSWNNPNNIQYNTDNHPTNPYIHPKSLYPTASQILSSNASLLSTVTSKLQPNILHVVRHPDANLSDPNQSVVQAVKFHPGSDENTPLLLTAGLDKTLRFFRLGDDKKSEKIHGIHFPTLPIHSASFLGDTGNVIVSGRRPFFYIYDSVHGKVEKIPQLCGRSERSLEKHTVSPDGSIIAFVGNDGYILLVDAKTKLWIGDFKMNGSCRAITFTPDCKEILSSGSDGDVYRWNLSSRRCVEKFSNMDGTITSFLSATSRYIAVGAESGVVNLYENHNSSFGSIASRRTPIKSVMNLHTSIDYMTFNHDGQILAMSTRREIDSLKLLHVPTRTVFSNWPTSKTPLGYVWSLDFSPGSKFMAIGNDKGKCLLYELNHYNR